MLALVFGIQRYHTYLYARPFVIITDHQPLVNITGKPIHSASPRLQRKQLTVPYRPGKQMILADALSCSPNAENNSPIQLDLRVDGLDMQLEDHTLKTIALMNWMESDLAEQLTLFKQINNHRLGKSHSLRTLSKQAN